MALALWLALTNKCSGNNRFSIPIGVLKRPHFCSLSLDSGLHFLLVLPCWKWHTMLQSCVSPIVLVDVLHMRSSPASISKGTYPGFPTPAEWTCIRTCIRKLKWNSKIYLVQLTLRIISYINGYYYYIIMKGISLPLNLWHFTQTCLFLNLVFKWHYLFFFFPVVLQFPSLNEKCHC